MSSAQPGAKAVSDLHFQAKFFGVLILLVLSYVLAAVLPVGGRMIMGNTGDVTQVTKVSDSLLDLAKVLIGLLGGLVAGQVKVSA